MSTFTVRNTKAIEIVGGLAWSGDVYHSGCKVATVSNDGHGGCCDWYWSSPALERTFRALASTRYPEDAESADRYVGDLWDAAHLAGN